MKLKITLLFLLTFFLNSFAVTAQGLTNFLPLQAGNVWVYECSTQGLMCGSCTGRTRVSITGSTVINGRTYYQSQTTTTFIAGSCPTCGNSILPLNMVRVDPLSANVFLYNSPGCPYTPGEKMLDSFKARLGDTIRMDCQPPSQFSRYICTDTNNATVLGSSRQSRIYNHSGFEGALQRRYAMGIGCYFASTIGIEGGTYPCTRSMTLKGCVINGVVYGDTSTLVGIQQISSEIPQNYSLHQNYPNPFNPATNIKFDLPKSGFVKLLIYDALGREITQLVNQHLVAGSYSADWDASNYPSGVYFYKLVVGDNTNNGELVETKKMVLVK